MLKKNNKIEEPILRICISVFIFIVLFLSSGFFLGISENCTYWFIMLAFCLVPLVHIFWFGNKKIRIITSLGLVLTLISIAYDYTSQNNYAKKSIEAIAKTIDNSLSTTLKKKIDRFAKHN